MKSLNRTQLIGHVGADPDVRYTATDPKKAVANFSIATNERWKDGEEWREDLQWHRCVAWGGLAELIEQKLHKGSPVYVEGRLKTRKWTDKEKVDRQATEIVVDDFNALGDPTSNGTANGTAADNPTAAKSKESTNGGRRKQ